MEALKGGEPDILSMKAEYKRRRNVIHGALNALGLTCHRPAGAFYVFPSIRATGLSSHEFCMRLLDEENVACVPGTAFGPSGEGFIRCSYATSLEEIREAMERMGAFVGRL